MGTPTTFYYKGIPIDSAPCCTQDYGSTWTMTGEYSEALPVVSHRPKPDVLQMSPTSLGPYFKHRVTYPIYYRYMNRWCYTGCPGWRRWGSAYTSHILCDTNPSATGWQNELAARVKDLRVNLAGDIAEYRETVDAFNGAAKAVSNAVNSMVRCALKVRKGDVRCLRKILPGNKLEKLQKEYRKRHRAKLGLGDVPFVLADANLGVSFGIAPTMNTLLDSMEALQGRLGSAVYRKIKFTKVVQEHTKPVAKFVVMDLQGDAMKRTVETVSVWVKLDVNAGEFTAGNPFEAGWELVPFSWLVDYLIPIGDYLSALDAYEGISDIRGTVTTRLTSMMSNVLVGEHESSEIHEIITPGSGEYTYYNRKAIYAPPAVPWVWYEPSKSWRALANSMSALLQIRRPRKPPAIGFFV